MLLILTTLILGLVILVWSADRFVIGASATASILGVSTLVVGILVVGFFNFSGGAVGPHKSLP